MYNHILTHINLPWKVVSDEITEQSIWERSLSVFLVNNLFGEMYIYTYMEHLYFIAVPGAIQFRPEILGCTLFVYLHAFDILQWKILANGWDSRVPLSVAITSGNRGYTWRTESTNFVKTTLLCGASETVYIILPCVQNNNVFVKVGFVNKEGTTL